MNVELLPIAEKKIRQMGGEAMGVVVRRDDGILVAVTDSGRVTRLDDAVAGPVGDGAQGAEPVAKYSFYLDSGIRFCPLDAFEGLPKGTGYLYTQPAAKVPEELAAHIRKMIELHERRSVVLSIHMQELEELLDTTPQQSGEWNKVLTEIAAERERQDRKWGGPEHDDQKAPNDFVQDIQDYACWARVMASIGSMDKYRRRMVQVAALAVAAVETTDRCCANPPKQEGE